MSLLSMPFTIEDPRRVVILSCFFAITFFYLNIWVTFMAATIYMVATGVYQPIMLCSYNVGLEIYCFDEINYVN